jgi:hypothetical protein
MVTQILIMVLYGKICFDFARGRGFFVTPRRQLGTALLIFGSLYLGVMILRYVMRMSLYPHERWLGELLPSHCMTPTRYRQGLLGTFRGKHRRLEFFDALRLEDAVNVRAIELRVDVIYYLGIVHSCESRLRTEVESCRSGEELPSIDQLINSADLLISRAARKTVNNAMAWRTW